MIYSLDSNVVIDVLRGRETAVRDRYAAALSSGAKMKLSSHVLHELIYGAYKGAEPRRALSEIDRFMDDAEVEDFSGDDAVTAGEVRAKLALEGVVLSSVDLFIAAQARTRAWPLVTNNVRHLGHVPDVTFYDWRSAAVQLTYAEVLERLRSAR